MQYISGKIFYGILMQLFCCLEKIFMRYYRENIRSFHGEKTLIWIIIVYIQIRF